MLQLESFLQERAELPTGGGFRHVSCWSPTQPGWLPRGSGSRWAEMPMASQPAWRHCCCVLSCAANAPSAGALARRWHPAQPVSEMGSSGPQLCS